MKNKTTEHNPGASETTRFFVPGFRQRRVPREFNKNPKKEPHMANKNTNPGSGKDDNEMRIQFGMILSSLRRRRINENMVWTDSQDYGVDEILYIAWIVLFDKINRLIREIIILFEVYPCFPQKNRLHYLEEF